MPGEPRRSRACRPTALSTRQVGVGLAFGRAIPHPHRRRPAMWQGHPHPPGKTCSIGSTAPATTGDPTTSRPSALLTSPDEWVGDACKDLQQLVATAGVRQPPAFKPRGYSPHGYSHRTPQTASPQLSRRFSASPAFPCPHSTLACFCGTTATYVEGSIDKAGHQQPAASEQHLEEVDEGKEYLEARFIGSSEACHKLLGFKMRTRYPAVYQLEVHTPNGQT
eukprot:360781-Chlamydomonas_euryale.AAC.6